MKSEFARYGILASLVLAAGALLAEAREFKPPETIEKYLATADYFDNCHFAARIRCKAYFASGYCDGCCPSEGVYIAYANAKGEKLLTVDPAATHCRTRNVPFLELLRTYTGR